ncbi:hypothetical protein NLG97_g4040 [Lecanicillium saksenae]|uniref:Uncharacterized protein n=1 Tax=Lecanicillium saksenae TaxID=468837 RepID=A0ACC1QZ31_9HYPO|nr:hypothetical protein NLG97_g4040 [Lecanicillium saksenae]
MEFQQRPATVMQAPPIHHYSIRAIEPPKWILIVRFMQFFISLVILGLSAAILSANALLLALLGMSDPASLGISISVITWMVLLYTVLTQKLPAFNKLHHIVVVMALDAIMLVLWLSTWALAAARRGAIDPLMKEANRSANRNCNSSKNSPDYYYGGYDSCADKKVAGEYKWRGDAAAAVAGLGALEWILFIITFAWTVVGYVRARAVAAGHQPGVEMGQQAKSTTQHTTSVV